MSLHLRPASKTDIPSLTSVQFAAFHDSPIERLMYPKGLTPAIASCCDTSKAASFDGPDTWYWKIVYAPNISPTKSHGDEYQQNDAEPEKITLGPEDGGEKIVAFARWYIFRHEQDKGEWDRPKVVKEADLGPVDQVNYPVAKVFLKELREHRRKNIEGQTYAYLSHIATQPEYRGLGAGTMLVKWGIEEAEKYGLQCWLQSTPSALPFYRHLGFEEVSSFTLDLGMLAKRGEELQETYKTVLMKRECGQ